MKISKVLCAAAILLAFTTSCEEDDGTKAPSLITDFVEAHTSSEGRISRITTDAGTNFAVTQDIRTEVGDTTYRCICTYTREENPKGTHATIYSISHIYSQPPRPASEFKEKPNDPVKVTSVWKTGKYVNIILGVMTTGQGHHEYAYSEDSTTTNSEGTSTTHISLVHKRPAEDAESYTQTVYLSIPVTQYYKNGSNVSISIPTYEGQKTFNP